MAFLIKRGKKWIAVWKEHGKNIRKTTGISVKGNAEKKLAQITADAMEAAAKETTNLTTALDAVRNAAATLGEAAKIPSIKEYLENFKATGTLSNKRNYQRATKRLIAYLGGSAVKRLDTLTTSVCKDFLQEELKRVSYGTVKHYKAMLGCAFKQAEYDDLIPHNPFARVSLSKITPAEVKTSTKRLPFTKEEMIFLLHYFPDPWKDVILTSFLTGGQRIGDVVMLKWEMIDFCNNMITFDSMKTRKHLAFPMHPRLRAMLESRLGNNSDYVFPTMAKKYMHSNGALSNEFTSLLRAYGILQPKDKEHTGDRRTVPVKSFHSIRHTVVTLLRSSNLFSADVTREVVGHDSEEVERAYFTLDNAIKAQAFNYLLDSVKKEGER